MMFGRGAEVSSADMDEFGPQGKINLFGLLFLHQIIYNTRKLGFDYS